MSIQKAARELMESGSLKIPLGTLKRSRMVTPRGRTKGTFVTKITFKSSKRLLDELKKHESKVSNS